MFKLPNLSSAKKDVKRFLADLLAWFIPVHMKRMTFLVTLYHYMMDDLSNEKIGDLEELNASLKIAKSDARALILPGLFTKGIWEGRGSELLNIPPEELHRLVRANTPCWLRYGRDEDVKKDVIMLREFILSHNH